MQEGRDSGAASSYEGGAGVCANPSESKSASAGKDDNSASGSPSPTPSPPSSPTPPPPLFPAVATTAAPGGFGMGLIMGVGMAPHQPLGLEGMGRGLGMGMAATSITGLGNVGVGEDLARKKRGRPRKYGPEGMHDGACLTLSSPASSAVKFSSVSAGEFSFESPGTKRGRGRPRGSGRRQLLAALGEWFAYSAGGNFTPHIVIVAAGEDVATRILSFSHKGPHAICILSANGSVSNVTLRQPGCSGGSLTYEIRSGTWSREMNLSYKLKGCRLHPVNVTSSRKGEGRFEIISLSGSFTISENGGIRSRTGGISVSLAGPDGRVVGGGVSGLLLAASPIQVVVGSFLPDVLKQHKHRTNLRSPPLSTMNPTHSGVLTAARPLSQTNPPEGECKTPGLTLLHGHNNTHGETQNSVSVSSSNNSTIPPNYSPSSSFQPVSWHGLQSSAERKPSPDINVCLTTE